MIAARGAAEVALAVFGGQNTELSSADVPQGLSPNCQDMAFVPGAVFTRPPRQKRLSVPNGAIWAMSFTRGDGLVQQLTLDSLGNLAANGNIIATTQAGNRISAEVMYGRVWLAFSDGLHGADVPLWWDGWQIGRVSQDGPGAPPAMANQAYPAVTGSFTLTRSQGVVTAQMGQASNLQPGMQFNVSGIAPMTVGGGVALVTVNNDDSPGIATVQTRQAHGLVAGNRIALNNVQPVSVGGGVGAWDVTSFVETIHTNNPHNLQAGTPVVVSVGGGPYYPTNVLAVLNTVAFNFTTTVQNTQGNGGDVQAVFPLNTDPNLNVYTVLATPTNNTFTVGISYPSNVTWTTGDITFQWDGTFYAKTSSGNTLTYSQPGPDATVTSQMNVTPNGQIAPGTRGCVCLFQLPDGYITGTSPRVTTVANGGQYLLVSNIPIGPPQTVARILAFTGANGGNYFYLPQTPIDQTTSTPIGTATLIPDNTTTSVVLDFNDDALFRGIAIDEPGSDYFSLVPLGPCLGFKAYATRLFAWGIRNVVTNLLNMGFEGGYNPSTPATPAGWTVNTPGGFLQQTSKGTAWQIVGDGSGNNGGIQQPAYQDEVGQPILQPNTQYDFRLLASGAGTVVADIISPSSNPQVLSSVTLQPAAGFVQGSFSAKTPLVIPPDTYLNVRSAAMTNGQVVTFDEMALIYTENPYLKSARASYAAAPQEFDGQTGTIGPANDPNEIRVMEGRRDVLDILTAGPDGSLYEVADTASGEPGTWDLRKVAARCGASSVWGSDTFEDSVVWSSDTGVRFFSGGELEKLSQENQPWWDSFDPGSTQFCQLVNDPYTRRMYVSGVINGSPSLYMMDYRELNTASAIATSGTLRSGYGGKVFTSDLTRKWSPWSIAPQGMTLMQFGGVNQMTFCCGTGVYSLKEGDRSALEDDFGWFPSSYTTYFFIDKDEAQQIRLSTLRKRFERLTASISGTGLFTVTPRLGTYGYKGTVSQAVTLLADAYFDATVPLGCSGDRVAFTFNSVQGANGGGFYLTNLTIALKDHPYSPLRGSNT